MADMLKFRKGTLAQINAADKAAGTIYIAKDEKAMYVDIDASTRIRIGDFVRVATASDIPFPASTSALYYVEADNALLGYDGKNWKQINGTKDLADRLKTAEDAIAAHTSAIGVASKDGAAATGLHLLIENNADAIADLDDYVGKFTHDTAETIVEYIDAKTSGIATSENLEILTGRVTQAEKDIEAVEGTVSGHEDYITNTLKGDATVAGSVAEAKKAGTDAMAEAQKKTTMAAVEAKNYATKTEAQAMADGKDAAIQAAANAASAAQDKADSAYTLAGQKATLADVASVGYALATDVESDIATAKTEAINDAASKYATIKTVETLDGKVSKNINDIANINTALESVVTNDALAAKGYATTANVATAKQEAIDAAATAAAGIYATKTDLNATNDNVSTAQGRADDAYELAAGKTTAAAVKTQIEAYGYATTGYVDQAEADAVAAAKTAGDKAYAPITLVNTVNGHEDYITNTLKGAATVSGSVAEAKKAGTDALALIGDANNGLTKAVNANTSAIAILNGDANTAGSVAEAKKAGTDAAASASANASAISQLQADLKAVTDDYVTESELATVKRALQAEIDADIRAANAMEYVATIDSASKLPTSAKNGATYVVGSAFGSYAAGDMLIAQGTEDPDTGLITNPTWAHVQSGYDPSLDQLITSDATNNKIMLSNGTKTDVDDGGVITFAATGSASVSVAADNTVTIGMVWKDF